MFSAVLIEHRLVMDGLTRHRAVAYTDIVDVHCPKFSGFLWEFRSKSIHEMSFSLLLVVTNCISL